MFMPHEPTILINKHYYCVLTGGVHKVSIQQPLGWIVCLYLYEL